MIYQKTTVARTITADRSFDVEGKLTLGQELWIEPASIFVGRVQSRDRGIKSVILVRCEDPKAFVPVELLHFTDEFRGS